MENQQKQQGGLRGPRGSALKFRWGVGGRDLLEILSLPPGPVIPAAWIQGKWDSLWGRDSLS